MTPTIITKTPGLTGVSTRKGSINDLPKTKTFNLNQKVKINMNQLQQFKPTEPSAVAFSKRKLVSYTAQASAHVSNNSSMARDKIVKPAIRKISNLNKYSSLINSVSTEPTGAYASVVVQPVDSMSIAKIPSSLMS
jgi:hypothetical protein